MGFERIGKGADGTNSGVIAIFARPPGVNLSVEGPYFKFSRVKARKRANYYSTPCWRL